ncbi:MAG TPA: hypothetical protein VNX69_16375 [Steroidobacteraceae bacterium]|jgi:hypothetical protein|nr:hypothetical protein [Steroidobacteraceae bacterium]
MQVRQFALLSALAITISACGAAAAEEPSESQMKEAALYAINHPPGMTNSDPISIKFFKKEACDNPTPKGYSCSFDWQVASANIGASMYNNISSAFFYKDKDSGKWAMRPPF